MTRPGIFGTDPEPSYRTGDCDIAILISYSGDGGMERVANLLIAGFLEAGLQVDVLVLRREGGHFAALPQGARVLRLSSVHAQLAVPGLVRYLRRVRPPILLAAKDRAGWTAIRARTRAGVATRVFVSIGNTLSQALAGRSGLRRKLRYGPIRRLYPRANGIIASSIGVAEDIIAISGIDPAKVHVASNPVVTPALQSQALATPTHVWFHDGGPPVVISVGRLTRQKDFPTLLRAFAIVRAQRALRLLILGEGEERAALTRLVRELGLEGCVDLPGFNDNPYAHMAHAALFVLSSAWEGFGNVLVEAMALGLPIVSTDCRSGPREILGEGEYGRLVPVGDEAAMAPAIIGTIDAPPDPERQRSAALEYTQERSAARYMQILGIDQASMRTSC